MPLRLSQTSRMIWQFSAQGLGRRDFQKPISMPALSVGRRYHRQICTLGKLKRAGYVGGDFGAPHS